jgi:hypothetical protein
LLHASKLVEPSLRGRERGLRRFGCMNGVLYAPLWDRSLS